MREQHFKEDSSSPHTRTFMLQVTANLIGMMATPLLTLLLWALNLAISNFLVS